MRLEDEIKQQKAFENEYHRAVVNIIYTAAWLNSRLFRCLKPFGISPEQYNVLRILRGQNPQPSSVTMIQERMLERNSNASRLVEKLRQKGLIHRKSSSQDKRQVDIMISEEGLKLLEEVDPSVRTLHELQNVIPVEAASNLNDTLDQIRS